MFIYNLASFSKLLSFGLFLLGILTSKLLCCFGLVNQEKNVSLKWFEIKTINKAHDLQNSDVKSNNLKSYLYC